MVLADVTTSELGRGRYEFRARDDGSAIVGEQVRGARGERAGGAPFVGREPELAQVLSAFDRSRSDRTPILVSITGPPGIGKTRLRREVLARISAQAEAPPVILQRSEAYGRGHALGAAADVLRAIIGLPKGTTAAEAESAIVGRLGPATRDELTAQSRELLSRLLANEALPEGLDPRGSRDALWLAMTDLVLQVVVTEPTVIIMEDLQWADPESIGWLDHMLGRSSHQPLVVLGADATRFLGGQWRPLCRTRPRAARAPAHLAARLAGHRALASGRGRAGTRDRAHRRAGCRPAAVCGGARSAQRRGARHHARAYHRGGHPGQPRLARRGMSRRGRAAQRARSELLGLGAGSTGHAARGKRDEGARRCGSAGRAECLALRRHARVGVQTRAGARGGVQLARRA